MMDEKLIQFVDHATEKGLDHATIRQLLLSAGWKEKDIAEVFCSRDLELPIPKPPVSASTPTPRPKRRSESVWPRRARDAFLHLLAFGSLFAWATSLILLFFTYLDFAFPDPAWRISQNRIDEAFSIIRAELAIVIVAFPIFLIIWHYLLREVRRDPEKATGIRRWVGYLAIFFGALTLSGDLMVLVFLLLEGQLTVRLLLKTVVLFLIAGSLVLYLAYTLHSEKEVAR